MMGEMRAWVCCILSLACVVSAGSHDQFRIGSTLKNNKFVDLDEMSARIDAVSGIQSLIQQDSGVDEEVNKLVLDNGLTVLSKRVTDHPVVSVQVWHKIGSHNEDAKVNGISHLLEHLLFKGTTNRPIQFMRLFYLLGAECNAFTNYDVTVYYENAERDKLFHLLTLEADRMVNVLIDKEHVLSERDVVISELMGYESKAAFRLNRALLNSTFGPGPGYGLPVGGLVSDVEGFTVDEVLEHYSQHYGPSNATLVVVGDFEQSQLVEWISELFGTITQSSNHTHEAATIPEQPDTTPTPVPRTPLGSLSGGGTPMGSMGGIGANTGSFGVASAQHSMSAAAEKPATEAKETEAVAEQSDDKARLAPLSHVALWYSLLNSGVFKTDPLLKVLGQTSTAALWANLVYHPEQFVASKIHGLALFTPSHQEVEPVSNSLGMSFLETEKERRSDELHSMMDEILVELDRFGYSKNRLRPDSLGLDWSMEKPFSFPTGGFNPTGQSKSSFGQAGSFKLSNYDVVRIKESASYDAFILEVVFPMTSLVYSNEDTTVLHVLDQILSFGHTALISRTFSGKNLEWDQIATDFSSNLNSGWYTISAVARTEDDVLKIQEAISGIIVQLRSTLLEAEDLQKAKLKIHVDMSGHHDRVEDIANEIGEGFVLGSKIGYSKGYMAGIEAVTLENIKEFASKYFEEGKARIGIYQAVSGTAKGQAGVSTTRLASLKHRMPLRKPTQSLYNELENPFLFQQAANVEQSVPRARRGLVDELELIQSPQESTGYLPPSQAIQYLPKLPNLDQRVPMSLQFGKMAKLSNGMEIQMIKTRSDLVELNGRILVGSAVDPSGKSGLSSVTGHLLMQGNDEFTFSDFVMNMENDASSLSITPGRESTVISGYALTENFHRLMLILQQSIVYPGFDSEILGMVKEVLGGASNPEAKGPEDMARQLLQSKVFPEGHPYASFASENSIHSISRDDVISFYKKHVGPKTTRLVVSGNFDFAEMEKLMEEVFGEWKSSAEYEKPEFSPVSDSTGTVTNVLVAESADVVTIMGRNGISRCDSAFWVAMIASQILGGDTLSSRLGSHVRDARGLTYGVYSSYEAALGGGTFVIRMQTAPDKTKEALQEIQGVLGDFAEHGVTSDEIDVAKRNLMSQHTLSLELPDHVGSFMQTKAMCGFSNPAAEADLTYDKILAVTVDQVNEHIKSNMKPSNMHQINVGAVGEAGLEISEGAHK